MRITNNPEITVIDVFREIGYEPIKQDTWSVGGLVRNKYFEVVGKLPEKKLRVKTCGVGVHCFAVYPDTWRPIIAEIIREHASQKAEQLDLFLERN
jgi:hypothetical protein